MRKWLVRLSVFIGIILIAIAAGLAYLLIHFPRVAPAADVHVQRTPQRIERGRYLANHVAVCIDCHSTRDWRFFSGPVVPGSEGMGGDRFDEDVGVPGTSYAANITPAGLNGWSDGEILRAMTSGVSRDGRALFPLMPYPAYCEMYHADAEAIVSYLRTMNPVPHDSPASRFTFPMNLIVRTMPRPCRTPPLPDSPDPVARGKYLVTIAGCKECHTPAVRGEPVAGKTLAGGREFPFPKVGIVRSSNITPDTDTGIGRWTEDVFIARFRNFANDRGRHTPVANGDFNTVMPWTMYAGMTDADLTDVYGYLRTVSPVRNQVETFSRSR